MYISRVNESLIRVRTLYFTTINYDTAIYIINNTNFNLMMLICFDGKVKKQYADSTDLQTEGNISWRRGNALILLATVKKPLARAHTGAHACHSSFKKRKITVVSVKLKIIIITIIILYGSKQQRQLNMQCFKDIAMLNIIIK